MISPRAVVGCVLVVIFTLVVSEEPQAGCNPVAYGKTSVSFDPVYVHLDDTADVTARMVVTKGPTSAPRMNVTALPPSGSATPNVQFFASGSVADSITDLTGTPEGTSTMVFLFTFSIKGTAVGSTDVTIDLLEQGTSSTYTYCDSVTLSCSDVKTTLTVSPNRIGAGTGWSGVEGDDSEITMTVDPSSRLSDVTIEVSVYEQVETSYSPGEGNLDQDASDSSKWTYTPFSESIDEKDPEMVTIAFTPRCDGIVCGESAYVQVETVFRYLVSTDDHSSAFKYAKWKYDIDTSNLPTITYDPTLTTPGWTLVDVFFATQCRLGPQAFYSENMCASTIGHENVHGGQPWEWFKSWYKLAHWNLVVKDYYQITELPAYQWEQANAATTGLSAPELKDVLQSILNINLGKTPTGGE